MSMTAAHPIPHRQSLTSQAFHWALPRLGIYAGAAIGCMIAFTAWAAFYAYIWPGVPHPEPEAFTHRTPPPTILLPDRDRPQNLPPPPTIPPSDTLVEQPIVSQPLVAQATTTGTGWPGWPAGFSPWYVEVVDSNNTSIGNVEWVAMYQNSEPALVINWRRRANLHALVYVPITITSFRKFRGAEQIIIPFQAADIEERVRGLDKTRQVKIPVPNEKTGDKFLIFEVVPTN